MRDDSDSAIAISMKAAAAPMVIFASSVCVPRGPKAVLETLLEKSAPASALPGCKSTATIITMHDKTKSIYKMVVKLISAPNLSIVINDRGERFRLETRAADERAVYVSLRHQPRDVLRLHRTAVENP